MGDGTTHRPAVPDRAGFRHDRLMPPPLPFAPPYPSPIEASDPDHAAIAVSGLVKHYGDRPAVDGVDLTVARGEIVALLGPNGAGKTTTVEILEGYRRRDSGSVAVLG